METIFPDPIKNLPQADIRMEGLKAYLSQAENHQIVFMEFDKDVELPEHCHASQFCIVLEGKIDLKIDGEPHTFVKGDRYFIPAGILHSGSIYAGYADVSFFDEAERYRALE